MKKIQVSLKNLIYFKKVKSVSKLYTVVRADINPGYQLVQSCHAVADFVVTHSNLSFSWNKNSNIMVSLNIPNQYSLINLAAELKSKSIPYILFYEPDISAYTALCTTDEGANLMSKLPLALKQLKTQI